jgi:hypothetical protein
MEIRNINENDYKEYMELMFQITNYSYSLSEQEFNNKRVGNEFRYQG